MDAAQPILAIVLDVPSPGLAFDVYEHSGHRFLEMDEHKRRKIAVEIGEREVVFGNGPVCWVVANWADVFSVGRILKETGVVSLV
ncbi:hypothetical protein JTE90_027891 [Oedothorax gibbosus]|uniref:Uncharacterized protein n=1 Tax=Oedothorax gibbosus TaxID=931172 RepID=A0AAV6U722_9ARAC|nr:hypothetical protein JTE90_027891 [Oedothorax gibbosus]